MAERPINPLLKTGLELGPVIGFFFAYLWFKDDTFVFSGTQYDGFIAVTVAFVPVFLLAMASLWALTGHLSRMQVFTAILLVVLGGLSVWLNDERFLKIKPTLVYLLFGGALGIGLLRGRSYLQYLMEGLMPLQPQGWMILTRRMTALFLGLAVANEAIWRTMSTETWVYLETFGFPAVMFAFFFAQSKLFERYATEETTD